MSHNTFGHLFRVTTFGESHGPAIGCVVDGCPPGIALTEADIQIDLDRRRPGQSKFVSQRKEPDQVRILSGVFQDERMKKQVTTGTPIALLIENVDQRSKDYADIRDKFRPGHADYTYWAKYGVRDYRGGGRQSARETASRVAAGAIARKVLNSLFGKTILRGALVQMGTQTIERARWDWAEVARNPFFCPDAKAVAPWTKYLEALRKRGSSCGALIEVTAEGIPAGLGAPIYGKLDADLVAALMSINAVKGAEIGNGFAAVALSGDAQGARARAEIPVQQCRRHIGRHLDRPDDRRALRGEADLVHPVAAQDDGHRRRRNRHRHQRPPRPLRRYSRGARRRSDAGLRAGRSRAPASRTNGRFRQNQKIERASEPATPTCPSQAPAGPSSVRYALLAGCRSQGSRHADR